MHILEIILIFIVFVAFVCACVYFSNQACPAFGHSCVTNAPTITPAPWTETSVPVTTTPPQTYTELLKGPTDLTLGQAVAPLPAFGSSPFQYTLSLWIKLPKIASQWRNLVRFGPDDSHRAPSLYVWPNSTNLHYRHATSADWNQGFDSITGVLPNVWTHFAVSVSGRVMTAYINGTAATSITAPLDLVLPTDRVYFNPTGGQPDTTTAMNVASVWFYPRTLSAIEVTRIFQTTTPQ